MSDFAKPRLARGWVIGLYAPLVLLFLWGTWHQRFQVVAVLLFVGLLTIVSVGALRILSTSITAESVTQLTPRGRVRLRWIDVQQVRTGAYGTLVLKGDTGRIVIHCAFYHDFDVTWMWLAHRLQRVWPADEDV